MLLTGDNSAGDSVRERLTTSVLETHHQRVHRELGLEMFIDGGFREAVTEVRVYLVSFRPTLPNATGLAL